MDMFVRPFCLLVMSTVGFMTACYSDHASHSSAGDDALLPSAETAHASLTNTYWRPVELAGNPVHVAAAQREPHLLLVPDVLK